MTLNSSSSMFSDPQLESLLAGLATNEAETLIRTSALIQHISYRDGFGFNFVYLIQIIHILTVAPCSEVSNTKKYGATVKSGFDLELEFRALKACWLLIDVK